MIIVRGVNIFPCAVEEIVRSFPETAEYQVQVLTGNTLTELKIRVEPASPSVDFNITAVGLEKKLLESLSLRVPVTGVSRGTLPRFELKAKRWDHL